MKFKLLSITFAVALVASNAWWAGRYLELEDSNETLSGTRHEAFRSLAQALAVANTLAVRPNVSQVQMIETVKAASRDYDAFLIDGTFWIGDIGLTFDEFGRLNKTETGWSVVREKFQSPNVAPVSTSANRLRCTPAPAI